MEDTTDALRTKSLANRMAWGKVIRKFLYIMWFLELGIRFSRFYTLGMVAETCNSARATFYVISTTQGLTSTIYALVICLEWFSSNRMVIAECMRACRIRRVYSLSVRDQRAKLYSAQRKYLREFGKLRRMDLWVGGMYTLDFAVGVIVLNEYYHKACGTVGEAVLGWLMVIPFMAGLCLLVFCMTYHTVRTCKRHVRIEYVLHEMDTLDIECTCTCCGA